MIKIYCKYIPFKNYMCMTLLWFLIIREEYKNSITATVERHEKIHSYQQIILFIISLIILLILSIFTNFKWWYICVSLLIPFILYILSWIIEILLPPYDTAYKDICFEREAKALENDENYKSKLHPLSFTKYIFFNRK